MSAVTARLGQRTFTIEHPRHREALSDLRPGERARITGFAPSLPADHARRLFDLGFVPGVTIEAVRRAPGMDPVIYRVAECEIALRRALAAGIVVERP